MSAENFLNSLQNTEVGDFSFLDFDTIKQGENSMRILGIDAPEVQNWTDDGTTMADPYGATLSGLAANLAKQSGMTSIVESGEKDKYGRKLIRLQNEQGEDFTDKAYLEGVLRPGTFTGDREQDLFRKGEMSRAFNMERGIAEDPNDLWTAARNTRLNSQIDNTNIINALGINPRKQQAFNQGEYQSYQEQNGGYNPLSSYNPEYSTPGARYNNTAISPFKTSWTQAVGSMKSGFQGMLGAFNDMTNDETNWNYRTSKAKELERRTNNLPSYISNVGDIDSWKDMGEYTVGLMGGMAPYLAAIAGGSTVAALTAPAWMPAIAVGAVGALPLALIYSGQTYNEMEGEGMEDRNAAMAFTAGTIMATLDRLGLHGLMKAGNTLKNASQKTIAEAYQTKVNKGIMSAKKEAMKKKGGIPVSELGNYSMMTFPMAALAVQKVFLKESAELVKGLVGLVDLPVTKQLLLKQTGGDIVQGMTREGATELGQEMTQYGAAVLGSEKEWVSSEAGNRALNALLGGSLMGGILSPVLATPGAVQQRRRTADMFKVAKVEPDLNASEYNNEKVLEQAKNNAAGNKNAFKHEEGDNKGDNIIVPVTDSEREEVTDEYKQHRERDNKLANKGIFQWIKDIPKNFISRPLKWYWDSDMREAIGFNPIAESLISLFSQTNEDKVSGQLASDIENRLYAKMSNMLIDTITIARGYLGEVTTDKGRSRMQTVFANIYKAHKLQQGNDVLTEEDRKVLSYLNKSRVKEATNYLISQGKTRKEAAKTIKQLQVFKLSKTDKEFIKEVNEVLSPKQQAELIGKVDAMAEELNTLVEDLTGQKLNLTGEEYLGNIRPDKTKIKGRENEVRALLIKNGHSGAYADKLIQDILDNSDGTSVEDASHLRLSIEDVYPSSGLSNRVKDNPFNEPGMEVFGQQDLLSGMESTARELIHAAIVTKVVGYKGKHIKDALALIKRAAGDSWDPKFASDIISSAEIWMGIYKPIQNKKLKEAQANVTAFNLTTLLGTAGAAQIPELWAAFLGRISSGQGGRPLVQDLRKIAGAMAKHYLVSGEQILAKFSKSSGLSLTDSWTPGRLRMGAGGFLGIKYGAIGQMGINAEEVKSNKLRSALSQAFITVSLIKPLTDISRIGGDFIANDAIMHYMDVLDTYYNPDGPMSKQVAEAFEMIQETRVPPLAFLELWQKMKEGVNKEFRDVDWSKPDNFAELEAYMSKNFLDLTKMMDIARKSWVDNSLANPGASSKSRASNDPHLALLFQFRGYILTFAASIVPRLIKRATSGNPNQDVNAITTMAGLVAMGFLAQALKDEWKTEGRPYWLDDAEYFQRGVQASGMLGPFDFLLDAVNPIYGEASVYSMAEGLAGPSWGNIKQFGKIGKNTIAGESDAAIEAALKLVPIYGHKQEFRQNPIQTITGGVLGD